jgi:hypothetical protein
MGPTYYLNGFVAECDIKSAKVLVQALSLLANPLKKTTGSESGGRKNQMANG